MEFTRIKDLIGADKIELWKKFNGPDSICTSSSDAKDIGMLIWCDEKEDTHRENGPAVIYPNGRLEWFFNGNPIKFFDPEKHSVTDVDKEAKAINGTMYAQVETK